MRKNCENGERKYKSEWLKSRSDKSTRICSNRRPRKSNVSREEVAATSGALCALRLFLCIQKQFSDLFDFLNLEKIYFEYH